MHKLALLIHLGDTRVLTTGVPVPCPGRRRVVVAVAGAVTRPRTVMRRGRVRRGDHVDATAQRVPADVVRDDIKVPSPVTVRRMDTVAAKKNGQYGVVLASN